MNNKNFSSFYVYHSLIGVLLYFSMVIVFLFYKSQFANLYFLYIGNFLFCAWLFHALFEFTKKKGNASDFWSTVRAGLKVTGNVIIISCLILVVFLLASKHPKLLQAPLNDNGLPSILFLDAVVVNFFVGMFATLYTSITAKRNQKQTT
jgi:hypothetical protein